MAYQKTQWKDHIEGVQVGTPVNAVNMNKICLLYTSPSPRD